MTNSTHPSQAHDALSDTFRRESGRVLAALLATTRDYELAEDALQDAIISAIEKWPQNGIPRNPGAWLTTAARRKMIDKLRRATNLENKKATLKAIAELEQKNQADIDMDTFPDERLKLIFTCCHPSLAVESQIALTLNSLGGLSTPEIASAFFVPKATMAQRLVRAKRKIRKAGIPFRVPPPHLLSERLESVKTVIYLIFNEGYKAASTDSLFRADLCNEAIRLGMVLVKLIGQEPSLNDDAEAMALLAMMMLTDARRDARVDASGQLVLLEDQDRSLWHQTQIKEGLALLEAALQLKQTGPYQIQAAIAAIHAESDSAETTDWTQIAMLYDLLYQKTPSPVVALNRAAAVAMADGPLRGLELVDELASDPTMQSYYLFHAVRADLLRRAGWVDEAVENYRHAITHTQNDVEKAFLNNRINTLLTQ